MSQGQTHVEPAAQYEIETAAEPRVRARRVLTLLRSIQDCHRSLMKEKEAGGLNRAEMEEIDEAISRMASGQRSLFSLLRRLMTQELVNNGGGSLHVELVGNVQSEKDWKILEAIVDALHPLQQQLDQQGATSAAAASVASASAAASADESPGPLRRWILDRGKVILTVFTRILDLWLEDFVFLAMSRLNPIQWLVRRRWVCKTHLFSWFVENGAVSERRAGERRGRPTSTSPTSKTPTLLPVTSSGEATAPTRTLTTTRTSLRSLHCYFLTESSPAMSLVQGKWIKVCSLSLISFQLLFNLDHQLNFKD
ncbi:hypothetical protein TB2_005110 [Malus domestica]